ncbi:uncharacterized protein [Drosophila takahashii]|uniref:uncharacterized protein n=1 Tax=Drosophila takahashii TaxID=29030 RepID=UPI0038994FD4
MGDDANQNHDEMFDLERIVWHEVVDRIESRAFSDGNVEDVQERRRQVECALNRLMPWNDADFSRINVRDSQPFECNNRAEYASMMAQNVGATTRVCIGAATFWCNPSLLSFHSDYFERHVRRANHFREGADLTAVGFRAAYDWMRLQEPLKDDMEAERVVALLHTAMQLEMPSLQAECYRLLCGAHFREEVAFEVYLMTLKYPQLEALRKVMLQRIGAFFLAVVGSTQFLQMPLEDVMTMMQQSSLGVNSEVEVMLAIIRWLTDRPEEISKLLPQLIDCVRFTLMPLPILQKLWARSLAISQAAASNDALMAAFRDDIRMRERICEAMNVAGLRLTIRNRREFLDFCRCRDYAVDAPREWIYDVACGYHLPHPRSPYRNIIRGPAILVYASQRARRARDLQARSSRSSRLLPASSILQPIMEVPEEDEVETEEDESTEDFMSDYQSFSYTESSEDTEPECTFSAASEETFDEGELLLTDDERDEEARRLADEEEFNLLVAQANAIVAQRLPYAERNRIVSEAEFRSTVEQADAIVAQRLPGFVPMFGRPNPNPDPDHEPDPYTSSECDSDFSFGSDEILIRRRRRIGLPRNSHQRVRFRPVNSSDFESPRQVIPKNRAGNAWGSDWRDRDQGNSYLKELQILCKERNLVLPEEEEDEQPVEPEVTPPEFRIRPFESYVHETDRVIYEMLKELDEKEKEVP